MSNIAHLNTAALDTAAKFHRTMQKAGADFTGPMQSVAKRRNLVEYLELGCPKVDGNGVISTAPTPSDLAHFILGDDFITPEEVMVARELTYTDGQLEILKSLLPSLQVIAWCQRNNATLMPAPPWTMSFNCVRDLNRDLFVMGESIHCSVGSVVEGGWLALCKGMVPNSRKKRWRKQYSLLSEEERVPNVAEFAWGLTTYKEVRGIWLLNEGDCARTASADRYRNRVTICNFRGEGLSIRHYRDGHRASFIGLSSVWKPST